MSYNRLPSGFTFSPKLQYPDFLIPITNSPQTHSAPSANISLASVGDTRFSSIASSNSMRYLQFAHQVISSPMIFLTIFKFRSTWRPMSLSCSLSDSWRFRAIFISPFIRLINFCIVSIFLLCYNRYRFLSGLLRQSLFLLPEK